MERNVLYGLEGTYANRWLDKWAIIVTQDGTAGLNWEHSMLDGHTMVEFVAVRESTRESERGSTELFET
jgi:hypothetical protein